MNLKNSIKIRWVKNKQKIKNLIKNWKNNWKNQLKIKFMQIIKI